MNKGVFLCVGTGGHVLPAYNVIKSMLDQGIDKKNILIVTDERGIEYFKEKDFETIVYPFVSSRKGIIGYLLNLGKILKSIIYLYKSLKNNNNEINKTSNLTIGFQGGSQGAKEINDLVYKFCEDERYFDIDIIHIVGKNNEIINTNRRNYISHNYIDDMQSFYNLIHLQVSRAGGGSLEAAYLNIYQLLVPFKHGTTSVHQQLNAEYLEKINAARIIKNYEDFTNQVDYFLENYTENIEKIKIEAGNLTISEKLVDELIK